MPIASILLILLFLLAGGLFATDLRTHFLIRKTGKQVMADMGSSGVIPLMPAWQYEITAQWKEPGTVDSYLILSGRRKGLPGYRRGDYLSAYISPHGNYLVLS